MSLEPPKIKSVIYIVQIYIVNLSFTLSKSEIQAPLWIFHCLYCYYLKKIIENINFLKLYGPGISMLYVKDYSFRSWQVNVDDLQWYWVGQNVHFSVSYGKIWTNFLANAYNYLISSGHTAWKGFHGSCKWICFYAFLTWFSIFMVTWALFQTLLCLNMYFMKVLILEIHPNTLIKSYKINCNIINIKCWKIIFHHI